MKSIELLVAKENIGGRETFLTTYDLLKSAINNPTQGGFNVDEMIKRLRLLAEVEKHNELFDIKPEDYKDEMLERKATLELEDADFTKLKELFKEMKWGVVSKTIVDISNFQSFTLCNYFATIGLSFGHGGVVLVFPSNDAHQQSHVTYASCKRTNLIETTCKGN